MKLTLQIREGKRDFSKNGAKTIDQGKMKKLDHYFSPYTKINSSFTIHLNVKDKNHRTFVRKYKVMFFIILELRVWGGELDKIKIENVNSLKHHKQNNRNHELRKDICNTCK